MSKRLLLSCLLLALPSALAAQTPANPAPAPGEMVEVDPIRCWWFTTAGAVRIGETFDVSLTCAVLETEAVSVVVDESRLGNAVVQMAPFEVVSGAHPADLHSGMRRFFQYDYRLRIINPDVIGKDVAIPEIGLHYRVNSRLDGNAAVQGRDLLYFLPPQAIRVASLVPSGATDIRDATGASFSALDTLRLRAGTFNILGTALIALGSVMILLVLVRLARGARVRTPAAERQLSGVHLVGVAARELSAVSRERATAGWTDELLDRALASTRVIAAAAIGRPVSQRPVLAGVTIGEGRLLARGPKRGMKRIVSAPTTAHDLAREVSRLPASSGRRATLEALRDALSAFAAAQYSRDGSKDQSTLDEALARTTQAARKVLVDQLLPAVVRRWTVRVSPAESQA
ncbi:MAG: hypothetical protein AB7J63_08535 [Vicinamibacterales bacterium]